MFSNSKKVSEKIPMVSSLDVNVITEVVHGYKYLSVYIDDSLIFKHHIEKRLKKLKLNLSVPVHSPSW